VENQPHDEEVTLASDGDESSMGWGLFRPTPLSPSLPHTQNKKLVNALCWALSLGVGMRFQSHAQRGR
jgi:hypothetical protein